MSRLELKEVVELEERVWAALVRGDANADAGLLSRDFLGVYGSGFADKNDHVSQLRNGPSVYSYEILDPRIISLSNDIVLLSYLAQFVQVADAKFERRMYVTSVWRRTDGDWLNIFSQDTGAEE